MESIANKPDTLTTSETAPARRASHEFQELNDWRTTLNHPAMVAAVRITRLVVRSLIFFGFSFVEIVAELLAPIVLVVGAGWALLPNLLSLAGTEGPARDVMNTVVQAIPQQVRFGHTTLTPMGLIADGLLLIAIVALCRTVQTIVTFDV